MKLQLVAIADRGKPGMERLHLRVTADVNLSFFIVFDTTYISPNAISNEQRHAYWFPSAQAKAGDHIVLYTRAGNRTTMRNTDGSTTHFFYWGIDRPVWNKTGDCAVLFEVNTWQASRFE
jgi:hypothetical protein